MLEKNYLWLYFDLVYLIKILIFMHLNELILYSLTMFTKNVKIKIKFKNSFPNNCPSHLESGFWHLSEMEANLNSGVLRSGNENKLLSVLLLLLTIKWVYLNINASFMIPFSLYFHKNRANMAKIDKKNNLFKLINL